MTNLKVNEKLVQSKEQEMEEMAAAADAVVNLSATQGTSDGLDATAAGVVAEQQPGNYFKISIAQELTMNLLHTESLLKLVLQDIPLGIGAQKTLIAFVEKNQKLENLQLINC